MPAIFYTKVYPASTNEQASLPNKGWPQALSPLIIPGAYCTAANRAPGLHGDCATHTQRSTPWTPILIPIPIPIPIPILPGAAAPSLSAFPFFHFLICPDPGGGL